jgi:osmoprotectant transport system permease protein
MVAAGLTVAMLAVLVDGLLNVVQRLVVSPGISGRFGKRPGRTDAMILADLRPVGTA